MKCGLFHDNNHLVIKRISEGFILSNTLSENGGMTHSVCSLKEGGYPEELERGLSEVLVNVKEGNLKSKYPLAIIIDRRIQGGK